MKKYKLLGQHFLKSQKIINTIIEAADLDKNDVVLEIGPGKGILTKALLEKAGRVIAVEKDRNLSLSLKEILKDKKNLEIITGDIRDFLKSEEFAKKLGENYTPFNRFAQLKREQGSRFNFAADYKVVSNIPYYLTSWLFRTLLEETKNQPKRIVLMVQKEVGERIVAKPPKTNILALSIQSYGKPEIIAQILKTYFKPQPKIDSCVILISNISRAFFKNNKIKEKSYFTLINKGFSHKRKLLLKNLASKSKASLLILQKAFGICGINEKARAENLSLDQWACLAKIKN